MSIKIIFLLFFIFIFSVQAQAQRNLGARPTDTGGMLMAEQSCYDVKWYDLNIEVNPQQRSIQGVLTLNAVIVQPVEFIVLDLDTLLSIDSVFIKNARNVFQIFKFERRGWKVWISLGTMYQPGTNVTLSVAYGGKPRTALRPPWVGGFVWSSTADGHPWIGVACQNDGADIWWPCKDHPSDEPDSVRIHVTIPQSLICTSNGRLRSITQNTNETHTYHWFVSTPINNYGLSINIAPYKTIEADYKSITGEIIPVTYWVLPENVEKGQKLFTQILEHLRFHEELLGPYPFRKDKYGVAETPYLGMEHQTIIAYGNNYKNNDWGFDFLHHHELSHEWWGNLVTAADWTDIWIHEGFGAYMQQLYVEKLHGVKAYHQSMAVSRPKIRNAKPVAERRARSLAESYLVAPDYIESDGDNYNKGTWILQTMRYLIGDKDFFTSLRRMTYPDSASERIIDGRQCRFVSTDDYLATVETISKKDLAWFFEVYLRQPVLPKLISKIEGTKLLLRWEAPNGLYFPMPVAVQFGKDIKRIDMSRGYAEIAIPKNTHPVIDPDQWILMDVSK
ncbi:M1 family metallopeptidase [bacterium]|nr:M1 family metallopeptidase [bacterium]